MRYMFYWIMICVLFRETFFIKRCGCSTGSRLCQILISPASEPSPPYQGAASSLFLHLNHIKFNTLLQLTQKMNFTDINKDDRLNR